MSRRWDTTTNRTYPLRRIVTVVEHRQSPGPFYPIELIEETLECGHVHIPSVYDPKPVGSRRRCLECGKVNP